MRLTICSICFRKKKWRYRYTTCFSKLYFGQRYFAYLLWMSCQTRLENRHGQASVLQLFLFRGKKPFHDVPFKFAYLNSDMCKRIFTSIKIGHKYIFLINYSGCFTQQLEILSHPCDKKKITTHILKSKCVNRFHNKTRRFFLNAPMCKLEL